MKTAISIPDDLFEQVEACSKRLKISRSGFFSAAAREFLARHGTNDDATDAWNRAIHAAGQPGHDRAARAFRKRTKQVIRSVSGRR